MLKLLDGGNRSEAGVRKGLEKVIYSRLNATTGGYIITCNEATEVAGVLSSIVPVPSVNGIMKGSTQTAVADSNVFIGVERGLDTTEISPQVTMPATLQETQFIIEADYRLGAIVDRDGTPVPVSFIDDDQIASYYISEGTTDTAVPVVIPALDKLRTDENVNGEGTSAHKIRGPRDRIVQFKIAPSINLTTSDFLFDKLGTTIRNASINGFENDQNFKIIDSIVRLTSATTAYSIDIPVRYIKTTT